MLRRFAALALAAAGFVALTALCLDVDAAFASAVRPYAHQPVERVTDPLLHLILREMDLSLQSAVTTVNTVLPSPGGASFIDDQFGLYDDADHSKLARWELSGLSSGKSVVMTVPNSSGTLPLLGFSQKWSAANYWLADRFFVEDPSDTSKRVKLDASGITTATTRTLTTPNASGTLPLIGFSQVWGGANYYKADRHFLQDPSDTTKKLLWGLSGITTGTTRTLTAPNASGTVPLLSLAQTWSAVQTLDNYSGSLGALLNFNMGTSGAPNLMTFLDNDSPGPFTMTLGLSSVLASNVSVTFPAAGGNLVTNTNPVVLTNKGINSATVVNLTNVTGDIAGTSDSLGVRNTGLYEVFVYAQCTTADVTAGALTVTIGWTDTNGAQSANVTATNGTFPLVLTSQSDAGGVVVLKRQSGLITYATSHTGLFGSSKYALAIRILNLGF